MTCQTHFGSKLAASLSAATYSSNRFSCAMFWSGLVTKDCMQSQSSFELMRKKYRPYSTASSSSRIYNHIINRCFSWCSRAAILTSAQGAFLWCSVPNKYVFHLLHCLDCIQQETSWIVLMSPRLLSFSANLSSQKRTGAKSGQYRECRTAMPFYRVLTMLYDIQTHTLFWLSPLYILKHNAFQGQV